MQPTIGPDFREHLIEGSWAARAGTRDALYRDVRSGRTRRLAPGVFLPESVWQRLSIDDRFLALVHASSRSFGGELLFSHLSAAALWCLPTVHGWPARPEIVVDPSAAGASRRSYRVHSDGKPREHVRIDGVRTTGLARTLVDVARTQNFSTAVAMLDFALRERSSRDRGVRRSRVTLDEVRAEALGRSARGSARCARAVDFADGRSGSPGESVSRVGIRVLGLPDPVLQQRFSDAEGDMFADFWWPELNLVGEFDGYGKYVKAAFMQGRTTAQVVIDEKHREDRIRALGPRVVRWEWSDARSLPALDALLRRAGLRS